MPQSWTKYYPAGALAELDVSRRHLPELLQKSAHGFPERTALTTPKESWTFARLHTEAVSLASKFRDIGVSTGVRVAIMLPNTLEYVSSLFATWLVGGTIVQINSAYVAAEIKRILEHSGPTLLVTTKEQMTKVTETGLSNRVSIYLIDEVPHRQFRVASTNSAPLGAGLWPDMSSEIAVLQYTGGTTGLPKAVMLTHSNIMSNIEQRARVTFRIMDTPDNAKIVNTLPMCHVYGMTCVTLMAVASGMEQLIVPRFQVNQVLELIRDKRPFAFAGVPTMYVAFLREENLEEYGLDRVTVFNAAGAPLLPAQIARFQERVGRLIMDGFGISEASPSTHTNPLFVPRREGSSGIPLPFTEARTVEVGDSLIDVPTGEVGELVIRGPQVMKGYWNDPELTAQTLRDGWLLTGDLARIDEDGFLYVVGRQKEIIVASGYNIYPAEIERVIAHVANVAEVAVFGVPDEYRGETVKAAIVSEEGKMVDRNVILERCHSELAPFKVPTIIEIVDQLPRTAVGKIDKRHLASLHSTRE